MKMFLRGLSTERYGNGNCGISVWGVIQEEIPNRVIRVFAERNLIETKIETKILN